MLKSEIVRYVYKKKVERLDHSCRSTSMENFEALDYHLQIKIAKFHGSWRFQAMVECYKNIKEDRKDKNRLNEHLTFYWFDLLDKTWESRKKETSCPCLATHP